MKSLAGSRGGAPCGVWGKAPTSPSRSDQKRRQSGSEARPDGDSPRRRARSAKHRSSPRPLSRHARKAPVVTSSPVPPRPHSPVVTPSPAPSRPQGARRTRSRASQPRFPENRTPYSRVHPGRFSPAWTPFCPILFDSICFPRHSVRLFLALFHILCYNESIDQSLWEVPHT